MSDTAKKTIGQFQKQSIERLYENERLLQTLNDRSARRLLKWGQRQIQSLNNTDFDLDNEVGERTLILVEKIIGDTGKLIRDFDQFDEDEVVGKIIDLLEMAKTLS